MTSNWFESSFLFASCFCASNFQKCQVKNYKEDVVMNWNLYPLQEVDYAYRIAETFNLVVGWGGKKSSTTHQVDRFNGEGLRERRTTRLTFRRRGMRSKTASFFTWRSCDGAAPLDGLTSSWPSPTSKQSAVRHYLRRAIFKSAESLCVCVCVLVRYFLDGSTPLTRCIIGDGVCQHWWCRRPGIEPVESLQWI